MSEANFKSMQILHESLLQKQLTVTEENQQEFIKEVRDYIDHAKRAGSNIPSTRERDQVRANLRYWGNYIYSIDKTFPDTELAPSAITEKKPVTFIIAVVVFILLVVLGGIRLFRPVPNQSTVTASSVVIPTETLSSVTQPIVITATAQETEPFTPTPVFSGSDVAMTSPENGKSVLPKEAFKGAYTNLDVGSTIHLLLVRGDKFFPVGDFFNVQDASATGEWQIEAALYQDPEELKQAENLIVVPAVCFDQPCRETLANAVQTGFATSSLPPQLSFTSFTVYRDSSRVFYRNAYQAVLETRLVYSLFLENGTSYDLYTSRPDRSDNRPIKLTPNVSELFPNLSPAGTKIVYVRRYTDPGSNERIYSIAIMDSNGDNDHEITERTRNVLENPQWSPDGSYIAYAMGDKSQSSDSVPWNIHVYELSTQTDMAIFEKSVRLGQRYLTWLPDTNTNSIIYDLRPQATGTSGFNILTIGSPEISSPFFDTKQDDISLDVRSFENGYLFTYASVNDDGTHDIYAVIDSDRQPPVEGTPIRLTFKKAGEVIGGSKIASADYPIFDPDSDAIYYMRNVNIYRVEYILTGAGIELKVGPDNNDNERYGDLIIVTGLRDQIMGFDVGFMEAFFPLQ